MTEKWEEQQLRLKQQETEIAELKEREATHASEAPLQLARSQFSRLHINFDLLVYPDFHRSFEVVRERNLSVSARRAGTYWPLDEPAPARAGTRRYAVLRRTTRPLGSFRDLLETSGT